MKKEIVSVLPDPYSDIQYRVKKLLREMHSANLITIPDRNKWIEENLWIKEYLLSKYDITLKQPPVEREKCEMECSNSFKATGLCECYPKEDIKATDIQRIIASTNAQEASKLILQLFNGHK